MKNLFKKLSITMIMLTALFLPMKAEEVLITGTGTASTTTVPFTASYQDAASYFLYKNTEIIPSGTGTGKIKSIAYEIKNAAVGAEMKNFKIYMQNTTLTSISGPVTTGTWQLVYSTSSLFFFNSNIWYYFNFLPIDYFDYDATQNLLVKVCFNNDGSEQTIGSSTVSSTNVTGTSHARRQSIPSSTVDGCVSTMTTVTASTRPNIKLEVEKDPYLVAVHPYNVKLIAGTVIPFSSLQHPSVEYKRTATHPTCYITYSITGPKTNPREVYYATVEGTTTRKIPLTGSHATNPVTMKFTHAFGDLAHRDPTLPTDNEKNTGRLDLSNPLLAGGTYTVTSIFEVEGKPNLRSEQTWDFTISLPWDVSLSAITQPQPNTITKYPLSGSSGIPVQATVTNTGENAVDSLLVIVKIFKGNTIIYEKPVTWSSKTFPIAPGSSKLFDFPDFRATEVGEYRVEAEVQLLSAQDLDPTNNRLPKGTSQYIFEVSYSIDAKVDMILAPKGDVFIGLPIAPTVKFVNKGVEDISDAPARMVIKDPTGNVVYDQLINIEIIPRTGAAMSVERFPVNFIPQSFGVYTVTVSINATADGNLLDNVLESTFKVVDAMNGTYTINSKGTGARNFTSINNAVTALYISGVSGPVVFELTESEYFEGDVLANDPAIDFRSQIVGVNDVNTITFRPSDELKNTRGGVVINLSSADGIGFLFGQTGRHNNPAAPVNAVTGSLLKRIYANSEGYIIFDGGSKKALQFKIHTPATQMFRTPFYLAEGSKNITIKNCLIEGQTATASYASSLPLVTFTFTTDIGKFAYQADTRANLTYSAGVVMRNRTPLDPIYFTNYFGLDTININNVIIENNEISNFGYGVVTLGNGVLNHSFGIKNVLERYYNHNNKIIKNKIYNVGRAGVFAGYEENTDISFNRIYNVNGTTDAAGIIAGGDYASPALGYNNIGLKLESNEISNVNAAGISYGIKVEQYLALLQEGVSNTKIFPDVDENFTIANNAIWDINGSALTTNRVGIYLATDRNLSVADLNQRMITPKANNYYSKHDRIINNTIVIPDNGTAQTGNIAGIAMMQVKNASVFNNAIALLDANSSAVETNSAIFYNGTRPSVNDNQFDRNAFWVVNPKADYYRFVETKLDNSIFNLGFANEFVTLNQWINWTGADLNSIVYNFLNDMEFVGSNPSNLRVKSNPTPINSKLNNRGDRIEGITFDIDNNPRGDANQRYDIGANEFNGRTYTNDLEVSRITYPRAYQDLSPLSNFNDAEYVMTQAPIEVKTIIRNNGSIVATQKPIKVEIFREDTLGVFPVTPILTKTVLASVSATDDNEVAFGLADGLGNDDFTPMTYSQLVGYNVPAYFKTMLPNVTPRHRIRISIPSDEVPSNNVLFDKVLRFYLKRAGLNLLLTLENSHETITGTATPTAIELQNIAGRLNADTLIRAFSDIGWYQTKGESDHDLDLFERKGWEPRSVNYLLYRTMVWSDANDKALTVNEIRDVNKFITASNVSEKKNLIIATQEVVRENGKTVYPDGLDFVTNVLRVAPLSQRVFNAPVDQVKGVALGRDFLFNIIHTGFLGDVNPAGDIVSLVNTGNGMSRIGLYYNEPVETNLNSKIMSVVTSTIYANVVYGGLDWRHFANAEEFLRSSMDYIENNGGTIIPIELLSFNAIPVGKRVEMNWTTASEINSSRFDIERAELDAKGLSSFVKIDEMKANGNSNIASEYGPVIDRNVNMGSSYAYRLKMIDFNGQFSYSNEKIVTFENADGSLAINEIVPNPAVDQTRLTISVAVESAVTVELFDMSGRMVATQELGTLSAGSNNVTLDTKALASGSYRIVLTAGSTQTTSTLNVVK